MKIEVWSDFSCPFCYIGKKRLENALSSFKDKNKVQVVFKSFQLNPEAPEMPVGDAFKSFSELKGIPLNQVKQMFNQTTEYAKSVGLEYHMDKIQMVSTYKAHRLAKWARTHKKEKLLTELLMNGYFTLGLNLADDQALLQMVENIGLSRDEALAVLTTDAFEDVVEEELTEAEAFGIHSVPFFVFNRKYAVSGAQPEQMFKQALEQAFKEGNSFENLNEDDELSCGPDGCEI